MALNDPEVLKKILGQMATHGKDQGLEKVELPQKIVATLDEWNPDNGRSHNPLSLVNFNFVLLFQVW